MALVLAQVTFRVALVLVTRLTRVLNEAQRGTYLRLAENLLLFRQAAHGACSD